MVHVDICAMSVVWLCFYIFCFDAVNTPGKFIADITLFTGLAPSPADIHPTTKLEARHCNKTKSLTLKIMTRKAGTYPVLQLVCYQALFCHISMSTCPMKKAPYQSIFLFNQTSIDEDLGHLIQINKHQIMMWYFLHFCIFMQQPELCPYFAI